MAMPRFYGLLMLFAALSSGAWAADNTLDNLISETPRGTVDGRNPVFTLSRYPDARTGVRLFRNGVPLSKEQYQLSGKSVTTSVANVPVSGDHLLAVYLPGPPPAKPIGSEGGSDLVGAAIGDALKREEVRSSRAEYPTDSRRGQSNSLKSIQMLSERLESTKSVGSSEVGVDGLGDKPQAASLEMLSQSLGGLSKKPAKDKKQPKKQVTTGWELPN
jgi:hypothetical protein